MFHIEMSKEYQVECLYISIVLAHIRQRKFDYET